ncbi:DUF5710 domain-containing protein [Wielerella bovis]|uniref:DUF5710 domain-containing protein n=1 Tax=Wielerella bovis TaxID=2917790 RepID=UPI002019FAD0|nr:DUF5710 domain-containing protein [Wielerella bovis]ULJ64026.1 DUF5710 domain-containing protein [Wielerella bovis]ULJ67512.1 DUF5710 domain-containing protein [Wielerella bovis]
MKTYLNVPYAEKDFAKRNGAKWDSAAKKWYVSGSEPVPYMLRRFMVGYQIPRPNAQYQFMRGMP